MTPTQGQIERATKHWSDLAGEPITFEKVRDTYYAFGSEIAVLRLKNRMGVGDVGFSTNLKTWFYSKPATI